MNNYLNTHPSLNKKVASRSKALWYQEFLRDSLPQNKSGRILEVGPGLGEGVSYLAGVGFTNVDAVDIDEGVVNFCKENVSSRVYHAESIESFLRQKEGVYDLVIMSHVLEHIPKEDVVETLNHIEKSLSESGKLLVIVPNVACSFVGVGLYYSDFTHRTPFSPKSIMQAVKMSNFSGGDVYNVWPPKGSIRRVIQFFVQFLLLNVARLFNGVFGLKNHIITHQIKVVLEKNKY